MNESTHDDLFSESVMLVGIIHDILATAERKIREKSTSIDSDTFVSLETAFGLEVGQDEILWWVEKKEQNLEELLEKTKFVIVHAQKLKKDSEEFKKTHTKEEYDVLIYKIRKFIDEHTSEVSSLRDYVQWLLSKDPLAPSIMFCYPGWGSSRIDDRRLGTEGRKIVDEDSKIKKCAEIALGFGIQVGYTLGIVYWDVVREQLDSDEGIFNEHVPKEYLLTRAENEIVDRFSDYFRGIRDSLRQIILRIEHKLEQNSFLFQESFIQSFVKKAKEPHRVENNLWDFKQTLEMWEITDQVPKEEAEFEICDQIGSYANSNGGILIIGIENTERKVIGLIDLENKIQFLRQVISKYIQYGTDFLKIIQFSLNDSEGTEKQCLAIIIAQTKLPVTVQSKKGLTSVPIRLGTGKTRKSYEEVKETKKNVVRDNYDLAKLIEDFVSDVSNP